MKFDRYGCINGYKIIEDSNMIEPGAPYKVKRTIKERVFSLPWRPWRSMRTVVPMIPKNTFVQFGNKIVMHPEMAKQLMAEIDSQ